MLMSEFHNKYSRKGKSSNILQGLIVALFTGNIMMLSTGLKREVHLIINHFKTRQTAI